jgi:preprotein translocase subunit Sss1
MLLLRSVSAILALLALPVLIRDLNGLLRVGFDALLAVFCAVTGTFIALCAWFTLRGHRPENLARLKRALQGGLVVGAIGFAIGFFGPLIWAPDANQGPLLGIFITGPIGFVIGTAVGWFRARTRTPALTSR